VPTLPEAVALLRRGRAWLSENVEDYLAFWAEDMRFRSPVHDEPLRGKAAFAELVERSRVAVRPIAFDFFHVAAGAA
jgi:hypothetical protein